MSDGSPDLILVGASVRAAAFSALRAKFRPWCADLFADADLRRKCPALRLDPADYPEKFLEIFQTQPPGPWMYTGGLENHLALVSRLAAIRPLWGNTCDVLAKVRSPGHLDALFAEENIARPHTCFDRPPEAKRLWLLKPLRGSGGCGIGRWNPMSAESVPNGFYLQEFMEGEPCSAVFIGFEETCFLVGCTRQLVGEKWLNAPAFAYCGSIGPLTLEAKLEESLKRIGSVLVGKAGVRGIFGVDCIVRDQVPFVVEVNPRYTASVEVLEDGLGVASIGYHQRAFSREKSTTGLPSPYRGFEKRLIGKAVLWARTTLNFPEDGPWKNVLQHPPDIEELPAFADIPEAGELIPANRPVLTYFATGASVQDVVDSLRGTARDLDQHLYST